MSGRKTYSDEDDLMIRYLLGKLPNRERLALEERYFADDSWFQRLLAAEDELVDAYVRGELDDVQREAFEERLLVSPEQRQKVEVARELLRQRSQSSGSSERVAGRRRWTAWKYACAAAVLIAAAATWWVRSVHLPAPPQRAEIEQAAKPQPQQEKTLSSPQDNHGAAVLSIVLLPGDVRSSQEAATLRIPSGTESVRLQLEPEGGDYPFYRAVIQRPDGREVWRQAELKSIRPGIPSVAVMVPPRILPPGDYIITLSGGRDARNYEEIADFTFHVRH